MAHVYEFSTFGSRRRYCETSCYRSRIAMWDLSNAPQKANVGHGTRKVQGQATVLVRSVLVKLGKNNLQSYGTAEGQTISDRVGGGG